MPNAAPPCSLSGKEIDALVRANWRRFYVRDVVLGVGVSHREGELRFIVRVGNATEAKRLSKKFATERVGDLPVHVEVNRRVKLAALPYEEGPAPHLESLTVLGWVEWLVDRPALLLLGGAFVGLAVLTATFFLLAR